MVVIIFGLPGSGKSFFASHLATHLSAHYINSDVVRKEMGSLGKYTKENKLHVYQKMAEHTKELLSAGQAVVLDATFYRNELRTIFINLADTFNTPVFLIKVEAAEETVRERLSHPRADSEADYTIYQSVKKEFEEVQQPHLTLVSTNENIERMLEEALAYIQRPA